MQTLLLGILAMVASYSAFGAGFDGKYFTSQARESYYSEGGEAPGEWFGGGAHDLGLVGRVDPKVFARVLAGYDPRKPRRLIPARIRKAAAPGDDSPAPRDSESPRRRGKRIRSASQRCPGYDITFSVPKPVSALFAVGDEFVRTMILEAIDAAAKSELRRLESEVLLGRRGKGGRLHQHGKLVVAMFDHKVSRAKGWQPQLHRHAIVANGCRLADGSWSAVDSFELRKHIRTMGPMFRVQLARELKARLGIALEPAPSQSGDDAGFRIVGFCSKLCKRWSGRRSELQELLDGGDLPLNRGTAQARQAANLMSRQQKGNVPPLRDLLSQWAREAATFGVTSETIQKLLGQSQPTDFNQAYERAWKATLKLLNESESDFSHRQILQHVAEQIQHEGVCAKRLANRVKRDLKQSPEIVRLGKLGRETRYTTKEMWDLEEKLLRTVEALQARSGPKISQRVIAKTLRRHKQLDGEQQAAVRHLLTQDSAIRILTGVAGSGKTWTLEAVCEGLRRSGYKVIGGSLSGQATEELASKAKTSSRTIASYLKHLEKSSFQQRKETVHHYARIFLRALQGKSTWKRERIKLDKNTVLVLDEAAMIDTKTLYRILRLVQKSKASILPVGDLSQLAPILAGGPFHHLVRKVGHAELTTNYRQQDAADREASAAIRAGEAKQALDNYVKRGRLIVGKDRLDTIQKLVSTWVDNGGAARPNEHFAFTETREEARVVNRLCQQERLSRRSVTPRLFVRNAGEKYYRGDRVMFHITYGKHGLIKNGYRGTIVATNPVRGQLTVRLDREPSPTSGRRKMPQTITVSVRDIERAAREQKAEQGISLGFAGTTHKLQGGSTPNAYMLVGAASREMTYTQATRGEQKTFLFVDEAHAGPELRDLAKAMQQSRAKRLAHDVVAQQAKVSRAESPSLRLEL